MANNEQSIWLAAGIRTPFVGVDGPVAHRDSLRLSVPVVQAMAERSSGPIDFGVWGAVIVNLAYANLAREVWLEAKLELEIDAGQLQTLAFADADAIENVVNQGLTANPPISAQEARTF